MRKHRAEHPRLSDVFAFSIFLGHPEGISPLSRYHALYRLEIRFGADLVKLYSNRPKFVAAVAGMGNVLDEWF